MIFGQPCTHFGLAYFCSFNFQLSTNKNVVVVVVVVVVLLPLVQKWTSGHLTNVDTKSSKNSLSTLWCHISAELFTCSWFFNKILQNQLPTNRAAYFKTLWPPCREHCLKLDFSWDRFIQWLDVIVFLLPVIVLVLFSAGAFKTTLYTNTTSRIQLWIIFAS